VRGVAGGLGGENWLGRVGGKRTREMQVPNAELRPLDMHRQINLTPATEVLDIAIPAMFRPAGDRARALLADSALDLVVRAAGVHALRLRRLGDDAFELGRADQLGFALVPFCEDFC
jgi:hypothetical protein